MEYPQTPAQPHSYLHAQLVDQATALFDAYARYERLLNPASGDRPPQGTPMRQAEHFIAEWCTQHGALNRTTEKGRRP
jgi:hypothetical protein